jgi:uncharacterized membrane protein YeaQ/YmgE (transglycosylase-associated protein family)
MMLFVWVALGALFGSVSRWVLPGPIGWGRTGSIILGAVGALIGGIAASTLTGASFHSVDVRTLATAMSGAILVLLAYRSFALRSEGHASRVLP